MQEGTGFAPELLTAFAFALGLVVGSFLNVVIHRVPRGESIVHPRSRCPACGRTSC
jgi:leader peptidase (prepilin peptidase)/N-methyltransferase